MQLTLINGSATRTLASSDRGFSFGQGVTSTIRVSKGRPELWSDHINLLEHGAQRLGFKTPGLEKLLKRDVGLLPKIDLILKITLTAGVGDGSYLTPDDLAPTRIVQIDPFPEYDQHHALASLCLCDTRLSQNSQLAGVKLLNRSEQVLAALEWSKRNASDGLMRDQQGFVISSTRANLFLVKEGCLLTPDLSQSGVAGVMRQQVIRLAQRLSIPVSVINCTVDQVISADALFLTSALHRICPVDRFEKTTYVPSSIIEHLQAALESQLV